MSISDEVQNLQTNLENSYTVVSNKGGTLPQDQCFDNLPNAINTITTSGTVQQLDITPTTSAQQFIPSGGVDGYNPVNVSAVTSSIDANITAGNIKSGVSILGVNGSVVELNGGTRSVSLTSSSGQTFTPSTGKNAITSITVTPNNQARTVTPTTSQQSLTVNSGYSGNGTITVNAVTSAIDSDIKATNIKSGVNILGVNGSVVELNGQTKTVSPTTSQQTITPDSPKNGLTSVTVNAVTSAIDSNIQPENIKKDVVILGTVGTLETGGGDESTYLVQVIDYDGTVLKSDRLNANDTFTLPSNPSHSGLVFQSWASPVTITNNTVTVTDSDITIGATYITASGLSEFDITLTTVTGLSVTLNMNGTKNWGDGTSNTSTTHTYATTGNYTITCNGATITTSSSSGIMGQSSNGNVKYILTSARMANITTLSDYAFQYCYSLASITIPNSVTGIGGAAFQYCMSLTSITIPNSVSIISDVAFRYCNSLTSITIPSGVTYIGPNTFNDCHSLTSITIPSGIGRISNSVFNNCYSLTSITIPNGITYIDGNAFTNCYSLASITIPNSVTSIGGSAFQYCYSLTSLTIPSGVTSIGNYAFQYCMSLASITIPNSVIDIGGAAFQYCYSLTSLTIPSGVTSIGGSVFYGCLSITEYDFTNYTSVPTLSNTNAFTSINGICQIKVPASLAASWKNASNWSTYANYIVGV